MNIYKGLKKNLQGFIKWLFRIHVHGAENEPQEGGYLAAFNHISYIDVIVAAVAVKRQIHFMAKKELFHVPLLGALVKALGAFPVDRGGNAVAPIKKSIKLLESGEVVGMFPQGHRFPKRKFDTTRDEVKGGAAMAVWHAKCPVLPMFIATNKDKIALFRRIDIYVGKPIPYEEFAFVKGGTAEYMAATGVIFDRIAELAPPERRSDGNSCS
ncbi:MAG: 1-acyl-sn-glycerol-3-phosphate acyltransferase [Ruminococcaceae bacterium]|nr:1-acyl-sn-glycerol-3-phosphate acyltransferase [Oscillospiraceae bacterium]